MLSRTTQKPDEMGIRTKMRSSTHENMMELI
jgi:hypothetical protein